MTAHVEAIASHISGLRSDYHAWPNMTRLSDGRLAVAYNGGREGHIDPFGRIELILSEDDGETWTGAIVVADFPTDDRDGAITETPGGALLVNWFTSQVWLSRVDLDEIAENWPAAEGTSEWFMPDWTESRLKRWRLMRERLPAEFQSGPSRGWLSRSEDGGRSWSEPYPVPIHNTHGLTPLSDGRILFAGRESSGPFVHVSEDDGRTWRRLAAIPVRPGDKATEYHELHAVETSTGRIVAHIRGGGTILQTISEDGGLTWTVPASIGIPDGAGNPSHLLRLKNGDLVMSYGHRVPPWPIKVRVSRDNGDTWSNPIVLYDGTERADMGYPSTVELDDGRLVTVWYQAPGKDRHEAYLQAAHWRLVYAEQ